MNRSINTVIIGIAGRMGQNNYHLLNKLPEINLVGGIEAENSSLVGQKIEVLTQSSDFSHPSFTITKNLQDIKAKIDLIVDFSSVESTLRHLEVAQTILEQPKTGWVIGTTGFHQEQTEQIKKAAEKFPIVFSGNFSTGINLLLNLIKSAVHSLGSGYDIEVVEHHHREKVDAPSGTAQMMLDLILKEKHLDREAVINGRNGIIGKRKKTEIGISVLRGGGVIGQHEVHFLGDDEKLSLSHVAFNRDAFTGGVKHAIRFIDKKINQEQVGLFNMQDVLGLK